MNGNRSIDDTRQNLENILYGYYIKYTKMKELIDIAFASTPQSNTIDIYVDVFDMLKPIYSKEVYTDKQYVIVSSVINLAAHLRHYFRKYHNMWTRIYLVYADKSIDNHKRCCAEFGNDDYLSTLNYTRNNEFIMSQLELVKILAAYIEDVYFVRKYTMFPMFVYDNIMKNTNVPAIILTKNTIAYEIPALIPNTAVFRPRKYASEDTSFTVYKNNILLSYFNHINGNKTLDYMQVISPQHLSLLMALVGNKQFNLYSTVTIPVAVRILYEAIVSGKILNSHTADIDYLYSVVPDLSKYISITELKNRYNACDIVYQHLLYTQMPESLDYTWMVNFKDPATVQDINNKYFANNPLDLNSL
jgi:hypothetical protein